MKKFVELLTKEKWLTVNGKITLTFCEPYTMHIKIIFPYLFVNLFKSDAEIHQFC